MDIKAIFHLIINVLVSYFRFIWIPMLRVYGYYKYFHYFSTGIVFSRQNLTSTDVRFWRQKSIPASILTGSLYDNKYTCDNKYSACVSLSSGVNEH